jgi:proteasome lid subunit RPN8/RPN11
MRRLWRRDRIDRVDETAPKKAIRRELLMAMIEASKSSHPYEFVALLTGKKGVIEEFIMLPYESGETMAIIQTHALPIGVKIMGTVHSHPSPNPTPSDEDLNMFSSYGGVHIIIHYPYCQNCWKAYNVRGEETELEVID